LVIVVDSISLQLPITQLPISAGEGRQTALGFDIQLRARPPGQRPEGVARKAREYPGCPGRTAQEGQGQWFGCSWQICGVG